ncbi:hypothetical protein B0H13DRAFT_1908542 [Mycena leptocephala]|nr:hypothetical protein B0H13DRAFT_1908542 [Mycena leptocephala]
MSESLSPMIVSKPALASILSLLNPGIASAHNTLPSLSEDEFQILALDFAERFLALPIVQSNLLKCEVRLLQLSGYKILLSVPCCETHEKMVETLTDPEYLKFLDSVLLGLTGSEGFHIPCQICHPHRQQNLLGCDRGNSTKNGIKLANININNTIQYSAVHSELRPATYRCSVNYLHHFRPYLLVQIPHVVKQSFTYRGEIRTGLDPPRDRSQPFGHAPVLERIGNQRARAVLPADTNM